MGGRGTIERGLLLWDSARHWRDEYLTSNYARREEWAHFSTDLPAFLAPQRQAHTVAMRYRALLIASSSVAVLSADGFRSATAEICMPPDVPEWREICEEAAIPAGWPAETLFWWGRWRLDR